MSKKIVGIILGCMIVVLIGLFFINKPTETMQVAEVVPTAEPITGPTVSPYIKPTTTPIVEDEEPAEVKALVEEVTGVSQAESIVDVSGKEPSEESIVDVEKPVEEAEAAEATPTSEAVELTPAPSTEPAPTPTPNTNPNVTTTTTSDKQAEAYAEAMRRLEAIGGAQDIPQGNPGNDYGFHGNGTKYGDLQ